MKKYTEEELKALALDALKNDTKTEALYGYDDGTFLNPEQFEELKKEDKKEAESLVKVKNPNVKTVANIDELKARVAELEAENESLKKTPKEPKAPKEKTIKA